MYTVASVHGRFQPFHRGHLTYVLLAKERCEHLIVGITNPDPRHLIPNSADPKRHLPSSNPFTYYERALMIARSMVEASIPPAAFTVVPFPVESPTLLEYYCPKVPVLLRNRGDWTLAKISLLREHGWVPELLQDSTDLNITATAVRRAIADGQEWRSLVPSASAGILTSIDAVTRIRAALEADKTYDAVQGAPS